MVAARRRRALRDRPSATSAACCSRGSPASTGRPASSRACRAARPRWRVLGERFGARVDRVAAAQSLRILIVVVDRSGRVRARSACTAPTRTCPARRRSTAPGFALLMAATLAGGLVAQRLDVPNAFVLGVARGRDSADRAGDRPVGDAAARCRTRASACSAARSARASSRISSRGAPRFVAAVTVTRRSRRSRCRPRSAGAARGAAGLHPATLVLGMAPGGIAEMCITAKVLQLGVPLVTAFHVTRVVVLLLLTAPLFARARACRAPSTRQGAIDDAGILRSTCKYAGERLRPALDLLARIDVAAPRSDRRPGLWRRQRHADPRASAGRGAQVVGVDSSAAMLARARASVPRERAHRVARVRARRVGGGARARERGRRVQQRGAALARRSRDAVPAPALRRSRRAARWPSRCPTTSTRRRMSNCRAWRRAHAGARGLAPVRAPGSRRTGGRSTYEWLAPQAEAHRRLDDRIPARAAGRRRRRAPGRRVDDGHRADAVPRARSTPDEQRAFVAEYARAYRGGVSAAAPTAACCFRSGACSSSRRARSGKATGPRANRRSGVGRARSAV